jgi:hypothetical protein
LISFASPAILIASMFTKMALETIDIRVDEGISHAHEKLGGIIVFSIDVNPVAKFFAQIGGVSVGRFFRGRYRSQSGLIFDETSLSVEAIGFTTVMLLKFATILPNALQKETVLLKDYSTNIIYLVDKHPPSICDYLEIKPKLTLSI